MLPNKVQAGLLTFRINLAPHLPSLSASGILQRSSPVTAVGPSTIPTWFPIVLRMEHLNGKDLYRNRGGCQGKNREVRGRNGEFHVRNSHQMGVNIHFPMQNTNDVNMVVGWNIKNDVF